jgi:hypothetical protein
MVCLYKSISCTVYPKVTSERCSSVQIEATDRQIDALVYELYGPTEDARVVATDVENLVTLQFQITVQGIN